jgi:hypothetical protein
MSCHQQQSSGTKFGQAMVQQTPAFDRKRKRKTRRKRKGNRLYD